MADNFLERQYDDYLRAKAARENERKARWRKQLKAYQESLKQKKAQPDQQPEE